MRKVGVISLGSVPSGINPLVYHLAGKCLQNNRVLSGIEMDHKTSCVAYQKWDESTLNTSSLFYTL